LFVFVDVCVNPSPARVTDNN